MIEIIIRMMEVDDFIGKSDIIDIAKGKYKLPMSINEAWQQHKRKRAWR